MRVICVDDEALVLELTVSMCKEMEQVEDVHGFLDPREALEWINNNPVDVALLDINMADLDGITLAKVITQIHPDVVIIFVTGHTDYAIEAFELHVAGYLLKPISRERLSEELSHAQLLIKPKTKVTVKTFGNFDVFVDGKMVKFERNKAKEIFAFLVDKQGTSVRRIDVFNELWDEGDYDRKMQKQLDVMFRALKSTFNKYDITDIIEMNNGLYRVVPEKIDCDMYKALAGDKTAISNYKGEYMRVYEWSKVKEAYLTQAFIK